MALCCDGSYCDSQSNTCTLSRHPITAVVERQQPSIYHCRDGGSGGTCYTFWKGCSACGSTSRPSMMKPILHGHIQRQSRCARGCLQTLTRRSQRISGGGMVCLLSGHAMLRRVDDDLLITTTLEAWRYSIFIPWSCPRRSVRGSARRHWRASGSRAAEGARAVCRCQRACRRRIRTIERRAQKSDGDR